MNTIDVHARRDIRAIYRKIEEVEASAETREKLEKLADSGRVRVDLDSAILEKHRRDSVETTVFEV